MIWLLGGYVWLYVHRPFEIWPALGDLQFERGYMIVMLLVWLVSPGKGFVANRLHFGLAAFAAALAGTWVLSAHAGDPGCPELIENYFKVIVFYVLFITTVRTERDLRLLILIYLGAVGVYVAHSMFEYANGRYEWRMGIRRMVGVDVTFRDPNAFASALLYALPLTLPFWEERPIRVPRWLLVGFTSAVCLCILLTGSRAGFVGLIAFAMIVCVVWSKRKLQTAFLACLAACVFVVLLAVALPGELRDRYLTIVDSSRGPANAQASAEGRVHGFMRSMELWQGSPIMGHGPGSYPTASGTGFQPHNLYGQILSEMGIVGAVALSLLLICFFLNWRQTRRVEARLRALRPPGTPPSMPYLISRSVMIAVLLMLLLGMSGHNGYRYHWQWFAAFQAVAIYVLRHKSEAASRTGVRGGWTGALPALPLPAIRPRTARPGAPPAPSW